MKFEKFKWKNLGEVYRECFSFIKSSKKYIWIITYLFFIFIFLGLFINLPQETSSRILDYLKSLVLPAQGFNFSQMFWFLFSNNVTTNFFGFLGGIFFGIFSLFNGIVNGFVLGFVLKLSILQRGVLSVWRILPHGIFEIPALLISLGMGLRLGTSFFKKTPEFSSAELFKKSIDTFLLVVVPLLIIAGAIEAALIILLK